MADHCVLCNEVAEGKPLYKKVGSGNSQIEVMAALRALSLTVLPDSAKMNRIICWECDEYLAEEYHLLLEKQVAQKAKERQKKDEKKSKRSSQMAKYKAPPRARAKSLGTETPKTSKLAKSKSDTSSCICCGRKFSETEMGMKGYYRYALKHMVEDNMDVGQVMEYIGMARHVSPNLKSRRFVCDQCYNNVRRTYKTKKSGGSAVAIDTNSAGLSTTSELAMSFRRATTEEHAAEIARLLPPALANSYKIITVDRNSTTKTPVPTPIKPTIKPVCPDLSETESDDEDLSPTHKFVSTGKLSIPKTLPNGTEPLPCRPVGRPSPGKKHIPKQVQVQESPIVMEEKELEIRQDADGNLVIDVEADQSSPGCGPGEIAKDEMVHSGICNVCGKCIRMQVASWWYKLSSPVAGFDNVTIYMALQFLQTCLAATTEGNLKLGFVCPNCFRQVSVGFKCQVVQRIASQKKIDVSKVDLTKLKFQLVSVSSGLPKTPTETGPIGDNTLRAVPQKHEGTQASPAKWMKDSHVDNCLKDVNTIVSDKSDMAVVMKLKVKDNDLNASTNQVHGLPSAVPSKNLKNCKRKFDGILTTDSLEINEAGKHFNETFLKHKSSARPLSFKRSRKSLNQVESQHDDDNNSVDMSPMQPIVALKDLHPFLPKEAFAGHPVQVSEIITTPPVVSPNTCAICRMLNCTKGHKLDQLIDPPGLSVPLRWVCLSLGISIDQNLHEMICTVCFRNLVLKFRSFVLNKVAESCNLALSQVNIANYCITFDEMAMNIVADPVEIVTTNPDPVYSEELEEKLQDLTEGDNSVPADITGEMFKLLDVIDVDTVVRLKTRNPVSSEQFNLGLLVVLDELRDQVGASVSELVKWLVNVMPEDLYMAGMRPDEKELSVCLRSLRGQVGIGGMQKCWLNEGQPFPVQVLAKTASVTGKRKSGIGRPQPGKSSGGRQQTGTAVIEKQQPDNDWQSFLCGVTVEQLLTKKAKSLNQSQFTVGLLGALWQLKVTLSLDLKEVKHWIQALYPKTLEPADLEYLVTQAQHLCGRASEHLLKDQIVEVPSNNSNITVTGNTINKTVAVPTSKTSVTTVNANTHSAKPTVVQIRDVLTKQSGTILDKSANISAKDFPQLLLIIPNSMQSTSGSRHPVSCTVPSVPLSKSQSYVVPPKLVQMVSKVAVPNKQVSMLADGKSNAMSAKMHQLEHQLQIVQQENLQLKELNKKLLITNKSVQMEECSSLVSDDNVSITKSVPSDLEMKTAVMLSSATDSVIENGVVNIMPIKEQIINKDMHSICSNKNRTAISSSVKSKSANFTCTSNVAVQNMLGDKATTEESSFPQKTLESKLIDESKGKMCVSIGASSGNAPIPGPSKWTSLSSIGADLPITKKSRRSFEDLLNYDK